ncbi:hypothetical protein KRX57_01580 [Weeksellaceae bacterium TAE3-ERU29]|nr:hypothetical protein [Weeksellaceae bacterium TAE3-ERU29]
MYSKDTINNIKYNLEELSSIEKQKKYWFSKSSKIVSSYSELYEMITDDITYKVVNVGLKGIDSFSELVELFKELLNALENYEEPSFFSSDMDIINDEKWKKIVHLAKRVYTLWCLNEEKIFYYLVR